MPWKLEKRDGKHCVVDEHGETLKCYSERSRALAYQRALYANSKEVTAAAEPDTKVTELNSALVAGFEAAARLENSLRFEYERVIREQARTEASRYRLEHKQLAAAAPTDEELKRKAAQRTAAARAALVRAAAEPIFAALAETYNPAAFELLLTSQAGRQAERLVTGVEQSVKLTILESIAEGRSVPQTAAAIRERVELDAPWQAQMLARTDLIALSNGASLATAESLGAAAPGYKMWLSTEDERTREFHVDADRQVVAIGESFQVGGEPLRYPGDPNATDGNVINCRCTLVYADSPAEMPQVHSNRQDLAVAAAAWDESKHPRRPKGSGDPSGEFAPKAGRTAIAEGTREEDLDSEIAQAMEELYKGKSVFQKSEGYYVVTAPGRRTPEVMEQARAMWEATDGDIAAVDRALSSSHRWGTSWQSAEDEWIAARDLGGNGAMQRDTLAMVKARESNVGDSPSDWKPFNENDRKAFEARTEWHRAKFRELYPDGLEVYRGISGKRAIAPYIEGGEVDGPTWELSSWATTRAGAAEFAYGSSGRKSGVVVSTTIDPDDIWLVPRFGGQGPIRFTDVASEVVLLNREKTRRVRVVG